MQFLSVRLPSLTALQCILKVVTSPPQVELGCLPVSETVRRLCPLPCSYSRKRNTFVDGVSRMVFSSMHFISSQSQLVSLCQSGSYCWLTSSSSLEKRLLAARQAGRRPHRPAARGASTHAGLPQACCARLPPPPSPTSYPSNRIWPVSQKAGARQQAGTEKPGSWLRRLILCI